MKDPRRVRRELPEEPSPARKPPLYGPAHHFPATESTLIHGLLDSGEEEAAVRHVMSVYAEPLKIYARQSGFRKLGTETELINDFFREKVAKQGYLAQWRDSGRQLRLWLLTAFKFRMLELERARHRRWRDRSGIEDLISDDRGPESAYHRQAALAMVSEAIRQTQAVCRARGLATHWHVLLAHEVDGRPYSAIASELGVEGHLNGMARAAKQEFRRQLRKIVAWPGATRAAVDEEIERLKEAIAS